MIQIYVSFSDSRSQYVLKRYGGTDLKKKCLFHQKGKSRIVGRNSLNSTNLCVQFFEKMSGISPFKKKQLSFKTKRMALLMLHQYLWSFFQSSFCSRQPLHLPTEIRALFIFATPCSVVLSFSHAPMARKHAC